VKILRDKIVIVSFAGWSVERDARNAVQLYAPNHATASDQSSGAA
jgi:hypothetical protein